MTLEIAFVFLCVAQIVHFSRRWCVLSADLLEDFRDTQRRKAMDWRARRPQTKRKPSLLSEIFKKPRAPY